MQLPGGLSEYRQFIVWVSEPSKSRPGKTDKFPVHPQQGYKINAQDPASWMSFEDAQRAHAAGVGHGIGFVFTEQDPFFFLDIDNAAVNGQWSELSSQLYGAFLGCYFEISQSGTGMHIIGRAEVPGRHGHKNDAYGLELYTQKRFVALTGTHASGTALNGAQGNFDWLVANFFPPSAAAECADWSYEPVPEWSGPLDDDELIEKMLASRPSAAAAFGARASFKELWEADETALGRVFPDPRGFDHSSADAALCTHLAFWTGKDCERIARLFERSGLMRDKWLRDDYKMNTVLKGVAFCGSVLGGNKTAAPDRAETPESVTAQPVMESGGDLRNGYQFLGITQQQEHFAGCCYIRDIHRIFTPDGSLLSSEQFKVAYGGYQFAFDLVNEKISKNAWEIFTESQGYNFPKAHSTCFRPEHAPGAIIEEEGWKLVNTFVPVVTRRVKGDPTPYLDLIARMLPDQRDRDILMAYMAALIQFPGIKFNWAPLVQGTKGNGKTTLCDILAYCIGHRFTAIPDPEDVSSKFNIWLLNKALVIIDEAYVADRRDMENVLKRMITGKRIGIQGKGADQFTGDNRANFFLNSNYKNAVRLDYNERRYAVFFTAQQCADDILRDGMGGNYFSDLRSWLEKQDGYAICNDYLRSYQIPDELNPATLCHRAPATSAKAEAIHVSRGTVEQEILEAIEEGRPGFAGGLVSSFAIDNLLEQRRMAGKVPRNHRRELMNTLGYDYHPALKDGRFGNAIPCPVHPGKPRLYVKKGHIAANFRTEPEVARYYLEAQSGSTSAAQAFTAAGAAR